MTVAPETVDCSDARAQETDGIDNRKRLLYWLIEPNLGASLMANGEQLPSAADSDALNRLVCVAHYISEHFDERLPLARLSSVAGMSPSHLQRRFKAAFGVSPKAYQEGIRTGQFRHHLKTASSVTDAIYATGYGSISRVYGGSNSGLGMAPKQYREGAPGESITYACRETVLGSLMIAATNRGVCFAQFGDGAAALVEALQAEFPKAELLHSDAADSRELDDWVAALNRHLSDGAPRPDLPLDMRGTAFQIKVWQCLLSLKEGEILTYSEVAARINRPRAVRAVASACARNRIGLLIPCHRVLRADGSPGGYRWGLERKRALLNQEQERLQARNSAETAL